MGRLIHEWDSDKNRIVPIWEERPEEKPFAGWLPEEEPYEDPRKRGMF